MQPRLANDAEHLSEEHVDAGRPFVDHDVHAEEAREEAEEESADEQEDERGERDAEDHDATRTIARLVFWYSDSRTLRTYAASAPGPCVRSWRS